MQNTGVVRAAWQGFRFGLLLQLAVGPVSLYIFQAAAKGGFWVAFTGVLAAVTVDWLFVQAASFGLGKLIQRSRRAQQWLKFFGGGVLILFGAFTLLGAFGIDLLPALNLAAGQENKVWLYTALVTLSSPLTIVFWAGVFSSQMAEKGLSGGRLHAFGYGAVGSTLVCMTAVAALGSFTGTFLPDLAMQILNAAVGVVLMGFGVRLLLPGKQKTAAGAGDGEKMP